MAFANSAFGAKPNTGTTSAFGAPAAGGSLFGSSTTQTPQNSNSTSLFGGGNNQQQQQQGTGTSLFGGGQPSGQQGSSLFGGGTQQGNNQQQGTSLFGSTSNAAPATGTSSNPLMAGFGQQNQQGQQNQATNSLFGGNKSTFGSGGAFGQSSSQQQQQQPQQNAFGGSIFGGNQNQGANSNTTNTFGSTQQQQPQNSIFGGNTAGSGNNQSTLGGGFGGGGSIFGAKPPQQQQQSLGLTTTQQPAGPSPFTKSTKFNDLPDEIKKEFESIESHIQGRIQISKDLQQRKLGEEAIKGQELVSVVHRELVNTDAAIKSDMHLTRALKAKADQAIQDMIISMRIIDGFKNPQASGVYLKDHASFPLEFFARVTMEMREKLMWYKSTIEQIERKLSSLANSTQHTPQGIVSTLQAQHSTFLAMASKTAAIDAELQKIKAMYRENWRARTGSVRDPFNELDMEIGVNGGSGDFGMSGLHVR